MSVGIGLGVIGVSAYAFLAICARTLTPEEYSTVSVFWALVYLVGPGFYLPLEQETSRLLSGRQSQGTGGLPVVTRAMQLGALIVVVLVVATLASSQLFLDHLLDGENLVLFAFVISLVAYGADFLGRGVVAGVGRFGAYAGLLAGEGLLRLVAAAALAIVGVTTPGPFAVAMAVAPAIAVVLVLPRERHRLQPGPAASWQELSTSLGYLVLGATLAQALLNAGPLAVRLLASEAQQEAAGRFFAGLIIARVPIFLFVAVQASLLPKLARQAAEHRLADFYGGLRRLLTLVVVIGVVATVGALALGPEVVRLLFGGDFVLQRSGLAVLAAGSGAYMVAVSLGQALIALGRHRFVALGWLVGVAVFVGVTVAGDDLFTRVENGFLAGALAAAAAMAVQLIAHHRDTFRPEEIMPISPAGVVEA